MPNTNAASSAFGWQFQTNAALVLMLRNIKEADSMCIEGPVDDIEIHYSDGTTDYAQAKARTTNIPGDNSTTRFKEATHTLAADSTRAECRRSIYVTNDNFPLGKSHNDMPFENDTLLTYKELSPNQQQFILSQFEKLSEERPDLDVNLDAVKEHLAVFVMWFYGKDEHTRTKLVNQTIEEFLGGIDTRLDSRYTRRLYDRWMNQLRTNEATIKNETTINRSVIVEKSRLIWPLVAILIEVHEDDELFDGLDEESCQDIIECYGQVIDEAADRFDLITQIQTDYEAYKHSHRGSPKQMRINFTKESVAVYRKLVGADTIDPKSADLVTALIIKKVVTKRDMISKIREEVNLAD